MWEEDLLSSVLMLLSTTLQISWLPLQNTEKYNQWVTSLILKTGDQNEHWFDQLS